jgi:hypothetical protein
MKIAVAVLLCLALSHSQSAAQSQHSSRYEVQSPDPSGFPAMWPGGSGSLPTGPQATPEMILNAARTLWAVQPGIESMQQAGYLRRIDLDAAFNTGAGPVAVLGFQEPGHSPVDRQPVLLVVARADDYRWFTQVLGAVVETGSDGMPKLVESAPGNFLVQAYSSASKSRTPIVPNFPDPVIWSTAYDLRRGTFPSAETIYYATGFTPCEINAVRTLVSDMSIGAAAATIRSLRTGDTQGAAWGAAIAAGAVVASWVSHGPHCP